VESNQAGAQASAGDLEAARLSLQAELAQDYFQLQSLDAQRRLLDDSVAAFRKSLELTRNRYASGVASQVTAQTIALTNQVTALQILGRRMTAAVLLVQALGGGWDAAELPSASTVTSP
jgi:outer membrane protein TolC